MNTINALLLFCAISFLAYGASCLLSEHMQTEFDRYGLARYRTLTGLLQLAAAGGLLLGLLVPWIGGLAAAGLSLQMACGLGVRVRIRDPWIRCTPAAAFMIICGLLAVRLL
ncbi:MAG: DoxX family protein [Coraliomargarita sp.]